ncbi:Eukaryotic translation initiation factor 3 subunit K [Fusarium oxysporum f. sp. albedinis]|nr:Eukaryotic translation initiation factor 3 subunit K [Fusarium oxysporum f. sp. albedinis]
MDRSDACSLTNATTELVILKVGGNTLFGEKGWVRISCLAYSEELHRPESNALTAPPTKHCFDRGSFNGLRAGKKSCRHRKGKKGRNRHDGELAAGVRGDLMASFLRMSHYLVLCLWGPSYVSPAPPSRGT